MFRLGDAYLIYAEAHLRGGGGDPAQALAYVNALRQRAYGDPAATSRPPSSPCTSSWTSGDASCCGRPTAGPTWSATACSPAGLYVWAWKGGVAAGTATESFRDLYPLPASELTTNPNLMQNPGY